MTGALSTSDLTGLSAKELMSAGILFNKKYKFAQESGALERAQALGYSGSNELDFMNYLNSIKDDELSQYKIWEPNNPLVPYLEEALKYKDTNPYIYQQMMGAIRNYGSQSFTPSKVQEFMELLGDESARTNFNNQRVNNLEQAFSTIRESAHVEEVTNPINQIGLRKAAGLNDDLNGGSSIGSQEPGNIDQPELNQAVLNNGDSSLPVIASAVSNVFSMTMSFISQVKNMQLQNAELASRELTTLRGSYDDAIKFLVGQMPEDMFTKSYFDENGEVTKDFDKYHQELNNALDAFMRSYQFNSLPRNTRKYLKSAFSLGATRAGGVEGRALYEKMYNAYLSTRKSNAEIRGDERFSESFGKWVEKSSDSINSFWKSELGIKLAQARTSGAEADIKEYSVDKVKSLDTLFQGIEDAIPDNEDWSPYAHMASQFVKMLLLSRLLGM